MTTQRDFQPSTERGAMDDGDARLAAAFDSFDHLRQVRRLRRLAELLDVSAGNKGSALADQRHGTDLLVHFGLLKGIEQAFTHCLAEGVNRRVVDRDQRDIALNFEPYDICHDWPPLCEMLIGIVISRNHVSHSRIKESRYACR